MNSKVLSLDDLRSILTRLRQDPKTRRKFPKDLWESIIRLTETHPIEEICQYLKINPSYLKNKIRKYHEPTSPEFHEISMQDSYSGIIVIELNSNCGLSARIQGPLACLSCLNSLFRR